MTQASPSRRLAALCTTAMFCLAVYLPMTAQVFTLEGQHKVAESKSSSLPELAFTWKSARSVAQVLTEGWLDKNFAFRGQLIRWYNYYSARVFGSVAGGAPVVVGKEGWLFLAKDRGRDVMEEHRAVKPLTAQQLNTIADELKARQRWLAEHGIAYLVAVAPNKNTIYPEFLQTSYAQVGPVSRIDQIVDHLQNVAGVNTLDMRPALLEAKRHAQVYYATDSHWNAVGAFASYQAMIERLGQTIPGLAPMPWDAFYVERYAFTGGDLAYMVGMEEMVAEDKWCLLPKKPLKARGVSTGRFAQGYFQPAQASEVDNPALPKAVFLHDSYFWEILPFVGEHFSRAVYVWVTPWSKAGPHAFDKELILAERPAVVVEEIAERFLTPMPAASGPSQQSEQ